MEQGQKETPLNFNDLSASQIKKILNEEAKSNKAIERDLRNDAKERATQLTLLLLGSGEAGKSTIVKQLRLLHDSGFGSEERSSYVRIVRRNVVSGMKEILKHGLSAGLDFEQYLSVAQELSDIDENVEFETVVSDIKALLETPAVKTILSTLELYQVADSAPFFLNNIDRIASSSFEPTDEDILLSRVRTTSIVEYRINYQNTVFRIVDVAGQRSQRRKWVHFFEDVTALVFVASLSNYNNTLREDPTVNAMMDQIGLFNEIVNGRWFSETSILLYLNKRDLFEKKIETVPLTVCFQDYVRDPEFSESESGINFIRNQFLMQVSGTTQQVIYPHVISATEKTAVALLFSSVRDILMRSKLSPPPV